MIEITITDRAQIAEILERRANEVASFKSDIEEKVSDKAGTKIQFYAFPGSVELAITREVQRLRRLADKVKPREITEEDES